MVSNRLPITVRRVRGVAKIEPSAGGLVAALEPAMEKRGGRWVGWAGASLKPEEVSALPDTGYGLHPVELTRTEVKRYYSGFSNATLWPLFHSLPERARFERKEWASYEAVNRRFAEAAAAAAEPGELIWIHDYHVMRSAAHLRQLRPDARIAFFLHIPFPPYDVYRILPWYRELLQALLACDLIGFHSPGYVSNFFDCVERILGERVDRASGQVEHGDRTVQVGAYPLGIDYRAQERRALGSPRVLRRGGERVILGVDRLDYTKGIPDRIHAFERLLELHPEHRENVVLMQVAVPSREQVEDYVRLKREIDEHVGRVNGRFATRSWTPIRYLYRSIGSEDLAGLYRDADVALVTPLRDGMNLVAKEFVASRVEEPGVLILSRMAGAAETMHEALLVTPYNLDSVAENIHRALTMTEDARLARMRALQEREREHDLYRWLEEFLSDAAERQEVLEPVTPEEIEGWLHDMLEGRDVVAFFDYDGTLTPICEHPSKARLAPAARKLLERCARRPDTDVGVVSGRALGDVRSMVGLGGIVYAGNHGLEIEGPGMAPFVHRDADHFRTRSAELAKALRGIRGRGAWVEEKGVSLTFHFREADPSQHERLAAEAWETIRRAGLQPRNAHRAVEARPPIGWDKGHAVLRILRERYGPDWSATRRVLYIGDDETDEDAFQALEGLGASFRVGDADAPTRANRRLRDVDAVHTLLRWLAER